jgi:hypothetical protein
MASAQAFDSLLTDEVVKFILSCLEFAVEQ